MNSNKIKDFDSHLTVNGTENVENTKRKLPIKREFSFEKITSCVPTQRIHERFPQIP